MKRPWSGSIRWLFMAMGLLSPTVILPAESGKGNEPAPLMTPEQVAQTAIHPPGFAVTVFASEPDVTQPVALTFDERGRLWVVECHTYSDLKTNFDLTLHDRIVIFEDADLDGRFDSRKVFWDRGQQITSVEIGFGGVWVLCAPRMVFIPDRNGDDVPDGPPEPLLEGWDAGPVRHNIVNGLKWGPDGWLYGRHGIQATSVVGKPGSPESERTRLNCAIWRYHPTRHEFEVVCQGGTNPWGSDWDDHGELFFINTVIGHLWHAIPGAYYKRMYGEHLASHRYELIDQHADHYHFDTGQPWTASRNAEAGSDALGGGHAHSGLMIYLGDAWPQRYRNALFTLNFHGRRLNHERLEYRRSGVVGRHEPDLVKFPDPWFRGVDLAAGPDGNVFVIDWSDTGECHENDSDGVHRETGRIYRISYQGPDRPAKPRWTPPPALAWDAAALRTRNLAEANDVALAALQWHPNEWFVRQARRILQERAAAGRDLREARQVLRTMFDSAPETPQKLRALWALWAIGAAETSWLRRLIHDPNTHVRAWSIRLLADAGAIPPEIVDDFVSQAVKEPSAFVRLALASALQKLPVDQRAPLAMSLLARQEDAEDHNLPLLLWYGLEPIAGADPDEALRLAANCRLPLVQQLLARRLTEQLDKSPAAVNSLVQLALSQPGAARAAILRGMAQALRGWRKAPKPDAWATLAGGIKAEDPDELRDLVRELSLVFGDGRALDELRTVALSAQSDPEARRAALRQLIEARPPELQPLLEKLVTDRDTVGVAARGLGLFNDPDVPALLIKHFDKMNVEDRAAVVEVLVSRAAFVPELLEAIGSGRIPRHLVNAFHARRIQGYGQEALNRKLAEVWGEIRSSSADKQKLMARYKTLLGGDSTRQADLSKGRGIFTQVCGVCHKLYGEGATIGPDLTGAQRNNLDYLLENIVDPSAVVPADYRVSNLYLKDDRELSAVVLSKSERTITFQTATERMVLDRSEIAKIQETGISLMPEGLLEGLNDGQIRDLTGYLMHPVQVPLPEGNQSLQPPQILQATPSLGPQTRPELPP